jgi:hypothetical protein
MVLDQRDNTTSVGSLIQISQTADVVPPVGAGLSDIVQFRLIRDGANASGLFSGNDGYEATVATLNFDIHYQVDMAGLRQEYVK